MPTITKIICPVDFSEASHQAFLYADDFAAPVGADIVLVHAFDIPESYSSSGQRIPADPSITKQLEEIKSRHENVSISRLAHAGPAGDVICWAAEYLGGNLIIMGTHGRTGLKRALFGSTAEHVLRHARCPVLTIREQEQHANALPEPFVTPYAAPRFM